MEQDLDRQYKWIGSVKEIKENKCTACEQVRGNVSEGIDYTYSDQRWNLFGGTFVWGYQRTFILIDCIGSEWGCYDVIGDGFIISLQLQNQFQLICNFCVEYYCGY